jgi:hypothetical protein
MERLFMELIIFIIGLTALLIGSYTDLQKREVADWVNYGLIFTGFGVSLILSIVLRNYAIIVGSIIGFLIMLGFGCLMFYTGQWGGGDSKMLMGLGALVGLPITFSTTFLSSIKETFSLWAGFPFLLSFLILSIIVGAFYGLFWSIGLAIIHRKKFLPDFKKRLSTKLAQVVKIILLICALTAIVITLFSNNVIFKVFPIGVVIIFILSFYMFYFIQSIEKIAMIQFVNPEKLTEGDWISKDIYVNAGKVNAGKTSAKNMKTKKQYLCGPKDLGISKEQIAKLIKLKKSGKYTKKIEIKVGIPFVPSFLIAYLITYFIGIGWLLRFILF